jgi:lipoprotein-releasing system ATP-binding protein
MSRPLNPTFNARPVMGNALPLLEARGITKTFARGTDKIEVLKGVDLKVFRGDAMCIMGSSGAGKSTLLQILGTLDRPTSGSLFFDGKSLLDKSDDDLSTFRNKSMGFVFQFHHLMNEFTALENIMMPCQIAGMSQRESENLAKKLLTFLGLTARMNHYPHEMSGGEQQRVATARALVMSPALLLADEPTGNLDSVNGLKIQELFFELKEKLGLTLIVVSHDRDFARRFPKIVQLKDGQWI